MGGGLQDLPLTTAAPADLADTGEGTWLKPLLWAGVGALIVAASLANDYQVYVLTLMLINVLVAVSLNLIMGYAGQFAKASVAFMGLGAYATGLLVVRLGWSFWLAWPLAAILAALVGTLVALPALKLRGLYLAILTISFVLIVHWALVHARGITGGAGASGFSMPRSAVDGLPLGRAHAILGLALVTTILVLWLVRNLVASAFGRSLLCIGEHELMAPSLGIAVYRTKIIAFAISGWIAGLAGGLHGLAVGYIDPQNYWLPQLVVQLCMVAVGGLASLLGSALGAICLTLLLEALRALKGYWEIAVGALLLVTVVFFPEGLAGLIERRFPKLRERRHAR